MISTELVNGKGRSRLSHMQSRTWNALEYPSIDKYSGRSIGVVFSDGPPASETMLHNLL